MDTPIILADQAATEHEPGYVGWDTHGAIFRAPGLQKPAGPPLGPARMAAAMAAPGALWWPEADNVVQRAPVDGGSMVDGYRPKGLGHTTETSTWPGYATNFHPHVTVHLVAGRFRARGHIRHDRAARALRNLDGGVQTNRGGPRQLEIVAYVDAVEVDGLPAALEDGIGRYAQWLEAEWGVRRAFEVRTKPYPASYGLNNGLRLSPAAWAAYDAWLTHAQAPENDHGDTGALNWIRILEGDDMAEADILAAIEKVRGQLGRDLRSVVRVLTTGVADRTLINPAGDPEQGWITDATTLDELGAKLDGLVESGQPVVVRLADDQIAALKADLLQELRTLIADLALPQTIAEATVDLHGARLQQ